MIIVLQSAAMSVDREKLAAFALNARIATILPAREYVEAGGLMSYGASYNTLFRRSADYIDGIMRGKKPSELPIEQPTTFELIINLKLRRRLVLQYRHHCSPLADQVIE